MPMLMAKLISDIRSQPSVWQTVIPSTVGVHSSMKFARRFSTVGWHFNCNPARYVPVNLLTIDLSHSNGLQSTRLAKLFRDEKQAKEFSIFQFTFHGNQSYGLRAKRIGGVCAEHFFERINKSWR